MLLLILFSVLVARCLALDCQTVEVPGVYPRSTQDSQPITTVDFTQILAQLAQLLNFSKSFSLAPDSASNKTIKVSYLSQCLILGAPVEWNELQYFDSKDRAVVLQGYFGRVKADETDNFAEACLMENFMFLNQKCSSFSQFATDSISFKPYGEINNRVLLPILRNNQISFMDVNNDEPGPYVCNKTPLTQLIMDFNSAIQDVYCDIQDFMSLFSSTSEVSGCSDFQLKLADALISTNTTYQASNLTEICINFPKYSCPSRFRRSQLSTQLLSELSTASLNTLDTAIVKLSNSLLQYAFPRINDGLSVPLSPYPEHLVPFSYDDWVLSLRISSKLFLTKQQHADKKLNTLIWLLDLKESLRHVTKMFFDKYSLVINKLSATTASCDMHASDPTFECSSRAVIKNINKNKFNLYTNTKLFAVDSLYFISCFSPTPLNLRTNKQLFFRVNNTFVNENATIPVTCLNPHQFSYDDCFQFLSAEFNPNLKVGSTEFLLASNNNDILLKDRSPFTIYFKNNSKLENDKSYRIDAASFPITIHKGAGVASSFIDLNFVMNRISYDHIISAALSQLPQLQSFASSQTELTNQIEYFYLHLSPAEIALIIIIAIILLAATCKLVLKCTCCVRIKQRFKKIVNGKRPKEEVRSEYFPLKDRATTNKKMNAIKLAIKEFVETGVWEPRSGLDIADRAMMETVFSAITESRTMCRLFKPKLTLVEDKNNPPEIVHREFSLAYCLIENLSARLCPCLVPVHLCSPSDTGKASDGEQVENVLEKQHLLPLPSAPPLTG